MLRSRALVVVSHRALAMLAASCLTCVAIRAADAADDLPYGIQPLSAQLEDWQLAVEQRPAPAEEESPEFAEPRIEEMPSAPLVTDEEFAEEEFMGDEFI